jgi:hypothetical protein
MTKSAIYTCGGFGREVAHIAREAMQFGYSEGAVVGMGAVVMKDVPVGATETKKAAACRAAAKSALEDQRGHASR